jgi:hypothetical protein
MLTTTNCALTLDQIEVGNRLHDMAVARRAQGNYRQAEALFLRALEILESVGSPHRANVAKILHVYKLIAETMQAASQR